MWVLHGLRQAMKDNIVFTFRTWVLFKEEWIGDPLVSVVMLLAVPMWAVCNWMWCSSYVLHLDLPSSIYDHDLASETLGTSCQRDTPTGWGGGGGGVDVRHYALHVLTCRHRVCGSQTGWGVEVRPCGETWGASSSSLYVLCWTYTVVF